MGWCARRIPVRFEQVQDPGQNSSPEALRELDDWTLWERWKDNDRRAATILVERYSGMLHRFFRNKVWDTEDATELISETLLGCVGALDRAEPTGPFRSFLFAIAMNTLRRYIRVTFKRKQEVEDFDEVCVGDIDDTPSAFVSRNSETRLLVRALRRLPMKFQIVLELQFFEQMPGAEISELLGMPAATVYTRQRRARAKLRTIVEDLASSPSVAQSTMMGIETWAHQVRAQLAPSADSADEQS